MAWCAQRTQAISPVCKERAMFDKILIANRGDQPRSGAAAKPHGMVRAAHAGDFARVQGESDV
jgi:hypothetical protein